MVNSWDREQRDLLDAAKRLRAARTACRRFLMLWAMSRPKGLPIIEPPAGETPEQDADAILHAALADPRNKDWSLLYRGSVLDD